jgi:hypothetical protein
MIAAVARQLLEEYNRTLNDPKIEDVYPYIERYAKQGSCEIRYTVHKGAGELALGLKEQGYAVETQVNEDASTTLTINWSDK